MKIRSTEKPHTFTRKLYEAIQIYDLQGLTLDSNYSFTAGIEAVEFGADEKIDVESIFRNDEWLAKLSLCNQLSVPLFVVIYKLGDDVVHIYEMCLHDEKVIQAVLHEKIETKNFAKWWGELKGTKQSKPLYEASSRISYFDYLLERDGLAWGGNIDGFILDSSMKTKVIIETRYTKKIPLEEYDPAVFFLPHYTRAGDYKTWEPVVLLASQLEIPLFLLTIERESEEHRVGLAVVDSISGEELKYQDVPPNKNILDGMENIGHHIMKNLSRYPPKRY